MGAEAPVAFQALVMEALGDAASREGGVLLVSHGGVGQVIDATRRGIDPAGFYGLARYLNAQVVELADVKPRAANKGSWKP
jgi:broad specificity phosphatase PhoE